MSGLKAQAPAEAVSYENNWDGWLAEGDSIASQVWTIAPSGPTLENEATAVVKVKNLVRGQDYLLTETIVTNGGLTGSRSFHIRCEPL